MRGLRSEEEIISHWNGRVDQPVVSICCTTYNHERYIEDSLKGFLAQRTGFPFEIIIHDDCSTDDTGNVISKYAKKYPRIIKTIFQDENQYSQGKRTSFIAINEAKGNFISICEGDDYWISTSKLQVQVDLLEGNPSLSICFHPAKTLSGVDGKVSDGYGYCGDSVKTIPCRDIILKGGGYMPAASIMFRAKVIEDLKIKAPLFLVFNMTHFFYQIFGSLEGGALYCPISMSVYRSMHEGSWSLKVQQDSSFCIQAAEKYVESVISANKISGHIYDKEFERKVRRRILIVLNDLSLPVGSRGGFYKKYKMNVGLFWRCIWFLVFRWRIIHTFVSRVRSVFDVKAVGRCFGRKNR